MNQVKVTERVQKQLFELQDLQYRDFQAKLLPTIEKETVIGVRMPVLRKFAKGYGKTEEDGKKLWGRQVIGQFQIKFSGNAKVSWKKNITHWTNSVSMVRRKDYLFS